MNELEYYKEIFKEQEKLIALFKEEVILFKKTIVTKDQIIGLLKGQIESYKTLIK